MQSDVDRIYKNDDSLYVAGLVVEADAGEGRSVQDTLEFVGDADGVCAVLDLARRDIVMLQRHREVGGSH